MRCIFILLGSGFLWHPGVLYSQEQKNSFALSLGASNLHLLDSHASPLIFRNTGIAPLLQYSRHGKIFLHSLEAAFFFNKLKASPDNFSTRSHEGRLRYSLLYKKRSGRTGPLHLYIGGSLSSDFSRWDYNYSYPGTASARGITSWYWSHSLDLSSQLEYKFPNSDHLSLRLFLPVISNVSRPGYSPSEGYDYDSNNWDIGMFGKTVLFPRNGRLDAHFTYQKTVSARFDLVAGYEFCYARYDRPSVIKMYRHSFRVGSSYRF